MRQTGAPTSLGALSFGMLKWSSMQIGDRIRRTDPDTGKNVFRDIENQKQLDYYKSFSDTLFIIKVRSS